MFLYRSFRFGFRVMFRVLFRTEAIGLEHIPQSGPVVLCSNHISLFDPPFMGSPVKRIVHYMAKEELFRVPVLGPIIKRVGAFPVKRGGVSKESIKRAIQILKDGHVLGIFPEGTRGNTGGMGKKGAASLALRSGAAVIPVAIVGDYKLFKKMYVLYGPPVDLSEFAEGGSGQLEAATDKIMATIRGMIQKKKQESN